MKPLADRLHDVPQRGRVEWIGVSPGPRSDIVTLEAVQAEVGRGLDGDYHSKRRGGGKRQVTLIQHEHLPVIAALCERDEIDTRLLRRNVVVSGINLLNLKGLRFAIGDAVLEGTGPCDPCSRMEENLGPGGWQAMRGHGGLTARVVQAGAIRVGDEVRVVAEPAPIAGESA
jgi:MOSC domain-containing protein YiiM